MTSPLEKADYEIEVHSQSLNGARLNAWQATAREKMHHERVADITPDPDNAVKLCNDANRLTTVYVKLSLPLEVPVRGSWRNEMRMEETKYEYIVFGVDIASTLALTETLIAEIVAKHDPKQSNPPKGT